MITVERFQPKGDACLSIFRDIYEMDALVFPYGATVLEIGCSEADWMSPMLASRSDLQILGIDWRAEARPCPVIRGDVLQTEFQDASFDVIVGISSIEHIGLGHYDADPLDPDGDRHCMAKVGRWVKPSGWVYLDVPFDEAGFAVCGTSHRVYDDQAVADRLIVPPLRLLKSWFTSGQTRGIHPRPVKAPDGILQYVALLATKD